MGNSSSPIVNHWNTLFSSYETDKVAKMFMAIYGNLQICGNICKFNSMKKSSRFFYLFFHVELPVALAHRWYYVRASYSTWFSRKSTMINDHSIGKNVIRLIRTQGLKTWWKSYSSLPKIVYHNNNKYHIYAVVSFISQLWRV